MMSKKYVAVVVAAVLGAAALIWTRPQPQQWHESTGVVWTTDYHILFLGREDLNDSIQAVLQQVDRSASVYNKASLVAQFNRGTSLVADAILDTLYQASLRVHNETGGAFDPTVMPLVNAWGFGYKSGDLPTRAQLDSILQFVGMDKITIDNNGSIVKEDPRVMLDFSSIAKGFACDEIGRMLQRNGARNWLVEIGGEVAASGVNSRGKPWHVSVDLPAQEQYTVTHESAVVLTLDSSSVATSGNYRKWRMEQGNKLSHIIDPRTGDSRAGTLLSVTVIAGDCMTADAWATACMVMGEEQVKNVMQPRKDLGVMTISADTVSGALVVWSNAAFASRINSMP